jgi:hypothetical protein
MSELFKFDLRLLERHLRSGKISEREFQTYLKDLPDLENQFDEVDLEELVSGAEAGKAAAGAGKDDK